MASTETEAKRAARRGKLKAPRGQAMVEYSIVSHFLLIGGTAALLPVITRVFEALNTYFDSVYTVIETAAI